MATFTGKSGAEIVINAAPWSAAKALKKAIEKEVSMAGLRDLDSDPQKLISTILKIDSSDEIDAALWPCLIKCTRANEKINEATFNDLEARKDYYDIVIACVKENLSPLVESLFSEFAKLGLAARKSNPAQPSNIPE